MTTTTSTVSKLQKAREKAGLTRKAASKVTGVSAKMIYQLEKGIRRLHADQIEAFAKAYNISTDYILGLTDAPAKPQYCKELTDLLNGVNEEKQRAILLAIKSLKESLK